jgi:iron complex transport system substrate-binding protein
MLTYLRLTGMPLGLLLNFGAKTMADGVERVANNFPHGTEPIGRRSARPGLDIESGAQPQ